MKVATPLALEVAEAGEIVSLAPRLEVRVTVFPEAGFEFASSNVTVTVEVEVPFAVSADAVEVTVEILGLTEPVLKVKTGALVKTIVSVVSVAVRVALPAKEDLAVNVTTPTELETPDAADKVSLAPRLEAKVTVFPGIAFEFASSKVTVIVEVAKPFAVIELGLATVVEFA